MQRLGIYEATSLNVAELHKSPTWLEATSTSSIKYSYGENKDEISAWAFCGVILGDNPLTNNSTRSAFNHQSIAATYLGVVYGL